LEAIDFDVFHLSDQISGINNWFQVPGKCCYRKLSTSYISSDIFR